MPDTGNARLFSPLSVVLSSLAFTLSNLPAIARWSIAPLAAGLAFHYFSPMQGGSGALAEEGSGMAHNVLAFMALGLMVLWLRVPLEVRVSRKVLLGEDPVQFYGQELTQRRTGAYLWAYLRVMCLVVAVLVPALIAGTIAGRAFAGNEAAQAGVSFVMLGLVYAVLAPRIVMAFPEVSLDGPGRLLGKDDLAGLAARARWRIVAVMAVIWAPEHTMNAMSYLAAKSEWWKQIADEAWFTLAGYVLGLATLVVSTAAGAIIYGSLREERDRLFGAPEPEGPDEDE